MANPCISQNLSLTLCHRSLSLSRSCLHTVITVGLAWCPIDVDGQDQELANCSTWTKSSLQFAFVNKVLLEPSHTLPLTYRLWPRWHSNGKVEWMQPKPHGLMPKVFTIWPFTENICQPLIKISTGHVLRFRIRIDTTLSKRVKLCYLSFKWWQTCLSEWRKCFQPHQ